MPIHALRSADVSRFENETASRSHTAPISILNNEHVAEADNKTIGPLRSRRMIRGIAYEPYDPVRV